MEESLEQKTWRLCKELTDAIYECVKAGYRVEIQSESYREFALKEPFTIVQANIYKGMTLRDLPPFR